MPASGFSMPTIILPRVVLPHPDSPTRPSASPASTCSDTPETAFTELTRRWRIAPAVTGYSRTTSMTSSRWPSAGRAAAAVAAARTAISGSERDRAIHGMPAREQVTRIVAVERWFLLATLIGRARAAGREAAAGRGIREVGGQARDADQRFAVVLAQLRDRAEQRLGVGMPHGGEDLFGRGRLDDPAGIHDADPVGSAGDDAHVMRHEQRRHAQAVLEVVKQREDLRLDRHVERRGRLIGEQHLRLAGQRDGDHHPLPQPPGELVWVVA